MSKPTSAHLSPNRRRVWIFAAMGIALLLFCSTFQVRVNGSESPYTTDVGEIQNALPRWGTIHWTGYPLYTFLGSLFTTLLHWLGVPPAAGTSLFSAVWGVAAVGLMVALLQELDVAGPLAALGALVAAVSTSLWMDASLAEVHTMTLALTLATLLFALRFGRSGQRSDLLLLTLASSQGVAHQRAVLFLAPAVALLVLHQWRAIWRWALPALGVALLAPLTYLYLPLRVRAGATWTFGSPGTAQQLLAMLLDNRAERIVSWPTGLAGWGERLWLALQITAADLSIPLLVLGLLGLLALALEKRWRQALALTAAWVPYLLLTAVIWIGRIGDAQLAAHLPVTALAAAGLAVLANALARRVRWGPAATAGALSLVVIALALTHRPLVLAVTRDPRAEEVIALAEQVAPPPDGRPTTLVALWGHDFWALAYAQRYEGRLPGLDIVDHNADFRAILARGDRLLTLSKTFYYYPLSWWDERLGPVHLSLAAPSVVEIASQPTLSETSAEPALDLENGLWIRSADLSWQDAEHLILRVTWQAETPTPLDYSVAVHLVAVDPPQGAADILAQADQSHPVEGWYPTSRWVAGELVRDVYCIAVPAGAPARAVRVAMYRLAEDGTFVNSPWLSLPVPAQ